MLKKMGKWLVLMAAMAAVPGCAMTPRHREAPVVVPVQSGPSQAEVDKLKQQVDEQQADLARAEVEKRQREAALAQAEEEKRALEAKLNEALTSKKPSTKKKEDSYLK